MKRAMQTTSMWSINKTVQKNKNYVINIMKKHMKGSKNMKILVLNCGSSSLK